jgi:hypothetical protein
MHDEAYREKVNMGVNNWMQTSWLLLITAIHFMYRWAQEQTSTKWHYIIHINYTQQTT